MVVDGGKTARGAGGASEGNAPEPKNVDRAGRLRRTTLCFRVPAKPAKRGSPCSRYELIMCRDPADDKNEYSVIHIGLSLRP